MKIFKTFIIVLFLSFLYNLFLVFLKIDLSYYYQIFLIFGLIILIPFIKKLSFISIFYILLNIIPTIISIQNLGFLYGASLFLTTGLLPVIFYEYLNKGFSLYNFNLLINYIVVKYSLYIILIPIELFIASKDNLSKLQFSGGQYNSIAILIIFLMVLNVAKSFDYKIKKYVLPLTTSLLFITILFSFSRGAIIVGIIILFGFFTKIKFKHFFLFISVSVISFFMFSLIISEEIFFLKYWLLRLDLASNNSNFIDFSLSNFINSFDYSSRNIFYEFFTELSFYDIFFGTGIGTSKFVIEQLSLGEFSFGSFHNMFLTLIIERGILFFTFFTTLLIWSILKMLLIIRRNKFQLFIYSFALLLFSVTTGFELFVNSRDFNIDFILLFFLLIYLINSKKNEFKLN
tara:strand:+ start:13078 stop:14283 length:1206 start_codon:yes stop_codon:yes gene_type:complete